MGVSWESASDRTRLRRFSRQASTGRDLRTEAQLAGHLRKCMFHRRREQLPVSETYHGLNTNTCEWNDLKDNSRIVCLLASWHQGF